MANSKKVKFERLPTDVLPVLYDITLKPDFQKLIFHGSQIIEVKVISSTTSITVNGFEITVTDACLIGKNNGKTLVPETEHLPVDEKIKFHFSEDIKPGQYELKLKFSGFLNDQLRGLYRNKYVTSTGEERYGAGTHFEATGARRAYPCWDEPAIKAKFVFTLIVPQDNLALSNMPVSEEKPSPDDSSLKVVKFQTTPIMSTYLTAVVVGQYDCVEDVTSNGIPVRVFTPVGKKETGRFALEVATKSLSYYEWYFDVPYGLPKIDLITLSEFPIGAMENWGLVTYRETCLLVDAVHSSAYQLQRVALVVAHELSHNWFGNLVTMEWWTDLWLKEGFATWMMYHCVDQLYPDMDVWMSFINGELGYALTLDSLSTSHPVEVEVGHPSEIDEIFDGISYNKGACLIRMLASHVGPEAFRAGMKLYLTRHQSSNTNTRDMWAAISEASGEPIGQLMDGWTSQMGFPLIKVEAINNEGQQHIVLKQEPFSSQAPSEGHKQPCKMWQVPYSVTTSGSDSKPVIKGVMKDSSISFDLTESNNWFLINSGQFMFYHVQYSSQALQTFVPGLTDMSLPPADRLGLLTDVTALSRANYVSVVDVFRLTKSYRGDNNFAVCSKLCSFLGDLGSLMKQIDVGSTFSQFVCQSLQTIGKRLGWESQTNEGHGDKLLREQVLTLLGSHGDPDVKAEALRRFNDHMTGKKLLNGDIKTPVYTTILSHGDKAIFDKMLKLYDMEDTMEEKNRIGRALGYIPDEELKKFVLNFSLSDKVRNQDSLNILTGVRSSIIGRQLLWDFVKDNWSELHRRYSTSTMLQGLVKVITTGACNADQAADIKEFFQQHEAKSAERAINQGLEQIAANVAFLEKQGQAIKEFLLTQSKS